MHVCDSHRLRRHSQWFLNAVSQEPLIWTARDFALYIIGNYLYIWTYSYLINSSGYIINSRWIAQDMTL